MTRVTEQRYRLVEYLLLTVGIASVWAVYTFFGPSSFLADLACTAYFLLGLTFWRNNFRELVLIFPFYFGFLGVAVSSTYLEHGAYISEQEAVSFATGGTLRLVSYLAIFFIVAVTIIRKKKRLLQAGAPCTI